MRRVTTRLKGLGQSIRFIRHASTKASHKDLTSFLNHATATNLSPKSTYYVGTLHEYTVMRALREFNMALHRTGGSDDKGIDLRGRWLLPHHQAYSDGIPVVVQCKAEKRPMGPRYLRELEGATMSEGQETLVLLATLSRFTEGARRAIMGSERPMGALLVGAYGLGGQVRQFIWNSAAGRLLGPELGVQTFFDQSLEKDNDEEGIASRVILTWEGNIIKTKNTILGKSN